MVQSGELSIVDLDAAPWEEPLIVKVGLGWAGSAECIPECSKQLNFFD